MNSYKQDELYTYHNSEAAFWVHDLTCKKLEYFNRLTEWSICKNRELEVQPFQILETNYNTGTIYPNNTTYVRQGDQIITRTVYTGSLSHPSISIANWGRLIINE